MAQKTKKNTDSTNSYFILKCLAVMSATALFTAAVTVGALKTSMATTALVVATTSSALAFLPLIPAILAGIALVGFLAYICCSKSNGMSYWSVSPGYSANSYPYYSSIFASSYRPGGITHGHGGAIYGHGGSMPGHSGGTHGHGGGAGSGSGGVIHSHSSATTTHGHR